MFENFCVLSSRVAAAGLQACIASPPAIAPWQLRLVEVKLPTFNSATTRVRKIEVVDEDVDFRRARLVTRNGESCDEVVFVHLMQGLW